MIDHIHYPSQLFERVGRMRRLQFKYRPGNILTLELETFLSVTALRGDNSCVLWAEVSNRLNILQCTAEQRITPSRMSAWQQLRNPND